MKKNTFFNLERRTSFGGGERKSKGLIFFNITLEIILEFFNYTFVFSLISKIILNKIHKCHEKVGRDGIQ